MDLNFNNKDFREYMKGISKDMRKQVLRNIAENTDIRKSLKQIGDDASIPLRRLTKQEIRRYESSTKNCSKSRISNSGNKDCQKKHLDSKERHKDSKQDSSVSSSTCISKEDNKVHKNYKASGGSVRQEALNIASGKLAASSANTRFNDCHLSSNKEASGTRKNRTEENNKLTKDTSSTKSCPSKDNTLKLTLICLFGEDDTPKIKIPEHKKTEMKASTVKKIIEAKKNEESKQRRKSVHQEEDPRRSDIKQRRKSTFQDEPSTSSTKPDKPTKIKDTTSSSNLPPTPTTPRKRGRPPKHPKEDKPIVDKTSKSKNVSKLWKKSVEDYIKVKKIEQKRQSTTFGGNWSKSTEESQTTQKSSKDLHRSRSRSRSGSPITFRRHFIGSSRSSPFQEECSTTTPSKQKRRQSTCAEISSTSSGRKTLSPELSNVSSDACKSKKRKSVCDERSSDRSRTPSRVSSSAEVSSSESLNVSSDFGNLPKRRKSVCVEKTTSDRGKLKRRKSVSNDRSSSSCTTTPSVTRQSSNVSTDSDKPRRTKSVSNDKSSSSCSTTPSVSRQSSNVSTDSDKPKRRKSESSEKPVDRSENSVVGRKTASSDNPKRRQSVSTNRSSNKLKQTKSDRSLEDPELTAVSCDTSNKSTDRKTPIASSNRRKSVDTCDNRSSNNKTSHESDDENQNKRSKITIPSTPSTGREERKESSNDFEAVKRRIFSENLPKYTIPKRGSSNENTTAQLERTSIFEDTVEEELEQIFKSSTPKRRTRSSSLSATPEDNSKRKKSVTPNGSFVNYGDLVQQMETTPTTKKNINFVAPLMTSKTEFTKPTYGKDDIMTEDMTYDSVIVVDDNKPNKILIRRRSIQDVAEVTLRSISRRHSFHFEESFKQESSEEELEVLKNPQKIRHRRKSIHEINTPEDPPLKRSNSEDLLSDAPTPPLQGPIKIDIGNIDIDKLFPTNCVEDIITIEVSSDENSPVREQPDDFKVSLPKELLPREESKDSLPKEIVPREEPTDLLSREEPTDLLSREEPTDLLSREEPTDFLSKELVPREEAPIEISSDSSQPESEQNREQAKNRLSVDSAISIDENRLSGDSAISIEEDETKPVDNTQIVSSSSDKNKIQSLTTDNAVDSTIDHFISLLYIYIQYYKMTEQVESQVILGEKPNIAIKKNYFHKRHDSDLTRLYQKLTLVRVSRFSMIVFFDKLTKVLRKEFKTNKNITEVVIIFYLRRVAWLLMENFTSPSDEKSLFNRMTSCESVEYLMGYKEFLTSQATDLDKKIRRIFNEFSYTEVPTPTGDSSTDESTTAVSPRLNLSLPVINTKETSPIKPNPPQKRKGRPPRKLRPDTEIIPVSEPVPIHKSVTRPRDNINKSPNLNIDNIDQTKTYLNSAAPQKKSTNLSRIVLELNESKASSTALSGANQVAAQVKRKSLTSIEVTLQPAAETIRPQQEYVRTPGGQYVSLQELAERSITQPGSQSVIQRPITQPGGQYVSQRPITQPGGQSVIQRPITQPGSQSVSQRPTAQPGGQYVSQRPITQPGGKYVSQRPITQPEGQSIGHPPAQEERSNKGIKILDVQVTKPQDRPRYIKVVDQEKLRRPTNTQPARTQTIPEQIDPLRNINSAEVLQFLLAQTQTNQRVITTEGTIVTQDPKPAKKDAPQVPVNLGQPPLVPVTSQKRHPSVETTSPINQMINKYTSAPSSVPVRQPPVLLPRPRPQPYLAQPGGQMVQPNMAQTITRLPQHMPQFANKNMAKPIAHIPQNMPQYVEQNMAQTIPQMARPVPQMVQAPRGQPTQSASQKLADMYQVQLHAMAQARRMVQNREMVQYPYQPMPNLASYNANANITNNYTFNNSLNYNTSNLRVQNMIHPTYQQHYEQMVRSKHQQSMQFQPIDHPSRPVVPTNNYNAVNHPILVQPQITSEQMAQRVPKPRPNLKEVPVGHYQRAPATKNTPQGSVIQTTSSSESSNLLQQSYDMNSITISPATARHLPEVLQGDLSLQQGMKKVPQRESTPQEMPQEDAAQDPHNPLALRNFSRDSGYLSPSDINAQQPDADVICERCMEPSNLMCSGCHTFYCSEQCQQLAWPEHEKKCYTICQNG